MPTYDYKCDQCQAEKEVVHRMSESPKVICYACTYNSEKKRIIKSSNPALLKGNGWFNDAYE